MKEFIEHVDDEIDQYDDTDRKSIFRRKLMKVLTYFFVAGSFLWLLSDYFKIAFNWTDSIPGNVFLIVKNVKPEKGELAAFNIPENDFYKNIWFTKYVAGVEGDKFSTVEKEGLLHIYLNDEDMGIIKSKSRNGIDLEPVTFGLIPKGYYFMWTPHVDSFDSRYAQIGLINEKNIIGSAIALF
jgi:conjugal transfer pilin signal peptidase TrbI